jgi:hypothetical protein
VEVPDASGYSQHQDTVSIEQSAAGCMLEVGAVSSEQYACCVRRCTVQLQNARDNKVMHGIQATDWRAT